jgi:hypothetical protein
MAKDTKTRKELREIIMLEVRAGGKCGDLESVLIVGPFDRGYANWDLGAPLTNSTNLGLGRMPYRAERDRRTS